MKLLNRLAISLAYSFQFSVVYNNYYNPLVTRDISTYIQLAAIAGAIFRNRKKT